MLPKAEEELRTTSRNFSPPKIFLMVSVETSRARRLTAWVRGLPQAGGRRTEVTGPPKSVGYDSVGRADTRGAELRREAATPRQRPPPDSDPEGRVPCAKQTSSQDC